MMRAYRTLLKRGQDETVIQKSRFIGWAAPCATEAEALALIREARDTYPDARHHCYAYILGANEGILRYSDDGEPGGTAGLPILETLRGRRVTDCCAVVTRYFGGILLGTGGLTRAYRTGCKIALDHAGVVDMLPTVYLMAEIPYPLWDRVHYELESMPVRTENTEFGAAVTFSFAVREQDEQEVLGHLIRITAGKAEIIETDRHEAAWEAPDAESSDPGQ